MSRKSGQDEPPPHFVPPPPLLHVSRPGDKGTTDPFYQFKRAARDDGKPYRSPEPKVEQGLLSLLATKGALVVMASLLAAVVVVLLVLLVLKA